MTDIKLLADSVGFAAGNLESLKRFLNKITLAFS